MWGGEVMEMRMNRGSEGKYWKCGEIKGGEMMGTKGSEQRMK